MSDQSIRSAAKQLLRNRDLDLSEDEEYRLAAMRTQALNVDKSVPRYYAQAAAVFSVIALVVSSPLWYQHEISMQQEDTRLIVEEVIIEHDVEPELLADYDFYEWINEQELDAG